MAGNGFGDFSSPQEGKVEKEFLSRPLPLGDANETSDVSACLCKDMTSEEEMDEVASATRNHIPVGKDGSSLNETPEADTEGDSSGEDGSLFEDIDGEDESQYGGHLDTNDSGGVETLNKGSGACHGIFGLVGGITDEVPFIRTLPRDLDDIGSLPSSLALLRKEDGCVSNPESIVEKRESETRGKRKEEVSLLAGISRDYGTSSGDEGGEEGGLMSLADDNLDDGQNSTLVVPLNPSCQSQESLWSEKDFTTAFGADTISGEDKGIAQGAPCTGQQTAVSESGPYKILDGQERTFTNDTPKGSIRKRGRATRELGALLMDSNAGRRGKRAFDLQGASFQESGQTSTGELTDPSSASNGMGTSFTGLGNMGEVRITRSQVSSRLAAKDDNLDSKVPESRGPSDIAAKRTGKRSTTRGGRLGWGNANESCQQSVELVQQNSSAFCEAMGQDSIITFGLPESLHVDEDPGKSKSKGKSGGRAKKARGPVKAASFDSFIEAGHVQRELVPSSPLTCRGQDLDGSEVVLNHEKPGHPPPSVECVLQVAVCSLNSQETEVLDVETLVENNVLGRRRSHRQAAKAGEKGKVGQSASCNGRLRKASQGRKRASTSGGKKAEEVLDMEFGYQSLKNGEDALEEITTNAGDSAIGDAARDFPSPRGTGRKPSKGKRNADSVGLGKKKRGSAVSARLPTVRKVDSGGRSKVKHGGDVELALEGSVTQKSASGKGVELTGDDSAGADQRSDKNTSSITVDTKEVCEDQEKTGNFSKVPSEIHDFESVECSRSKLVAEDGFFRSTEICNVPACLDSIQQLSEGININSRKSYSTVKLDNVSHVEDVTTGGVEVNNQGEPANCQTDSLLEDNVGNAEGDSCRDSRDDSGSATSCDSLVKKEGEVLAPDLGLTGSGGCGDLAASETATFAEHPETAESGKAKTRQRRVAPKQAGAQLGTQPSRKGKKGPTKKVGSLGPVVPQKKAAGAGSKKKKVRACRDKKKSITGTGGEDPPGAVEEAAARETSKIGDAVDGVDFVVQSECLDDKLGEQINLKKQGKPACSRSPVEVAKRKTIGVDSEGGLSSKQSSTPEQCKSSPEAPYVAEAKTSRNVKSGVKKPEKTILSTLEGVATRSESKDSDSRRSLKAKGTTIKALLSIKDQTNDRYHGISQDKSTNSGNGSRMAQSGGSTLLYPGKGEAGDVGVGTVSLNDADTVNVDFAKGSQVRENVDSPEDTGVLAEDMSSGVTEGDGSEEIERRAEAGVSEAAIPRKSWVLCDDCNKWRCIPVELADQIDDTNAKWSCRDNPNPDYADCSIPQEKSNAEINAELQISEVSATEEGDDKDGIESKLMEIGSGNGENKPAVWKLIRRNIFQHRRAKSQASDEIMVCQCTPPEDGGVGCGDNCLNRVLNIECVQEHCPCGEACSNQQFQKRMYAPVATFRCGKKGFGLRVSKHIPKDTFLIEYVGEVLDVGAFEERQQEYARNGQKHFYFMTLSNSEVIDACSKGNFGRFINHSCEPNCKTEKWMVNGEVCIGLFAVRDIAAGEEVTFDYNYVRVRGASAKKCECGSSLCRGYIGADSETTSDAVAESESDEEEDPEPIMIVNSDEEDNHVDESKFTPLKKQKDDAVYREPASTRPSRIKRKLVTVKEKGPTAVKRVKTSNPSRKIGSSNPKGLTLDVSVGRHESGRPLSSDVQEKLDDLLDKEGGLRKRKDVVAQYLKLLLLSVASGDSKKDASACSVRDVSLLLEALLRTSSRSVLADIVEMNGLRMLHNFIKQLRKDWDKTPILRKLMKVLDLLASDRVHVLTQSMINSAPPGRGMESFSESLFELTRHKDPEVCGMARRFRNKFMPPRPPVYEMYNKGAEKSPQIPVKAVSPVQMNSSNQMQLDGNHFSSPQKQSPIAASLKVTEVAKVGNGSSVGIPSSQSQSSSMPSDETTLKRPQVEVSLQNGPTAETVKSENVKRKRVSRWDAPGKVGKGTYEPIVGASSTDVPASDSIPSNKQTSLTPVPPVHSTGAQFQYQGSREEFNKKQRQSGPNHESGSRGPLFRCEVPAASTSGKQGGEDMSGTSSGLPVNMPPHSAWQPNLPGSGTSSGNQDSTRMPHGRSSGQPHLHSGCAPGLPQRKPELVYGIPGQPQAHQGAGPLSLPPVMPLNGPPPMICAGAVSLHPGSNQVFPANAVPPVGLPPPATMYPGCPPPHMGLGGPPLQGLHGMVPTMPTSYSQGVHFGQWGPALGIPHFAGPPAIPVDESRRYIAQPTWLPNAGLYSEDGSQRMSSNGEVLASNGDLPAGGVQTAGDVEPEPPVPGLSPPPSTTSNTHDSAGITNFCPRNLSQEQKFQPEFLDPRRYGENYISNEVLETRQDRDHDPNYHRAGISDVRDTGGGIHEEHWDDPESQSFRDHVFLLVRNRVRRHKLRARDIDTFCTKLADVIVRKEVAQCLELRNQGCEKIIVRSKLVEKVKSYVDNQVEQFSRKYDKNYKS